MRIIYFLVVLILVAIVVVAGVAFLGQLLKNFQPGKSRVAQDLRAMKASVQLFINDLIPWDKDELDILSFNQINQKVGKGLVKTAQGVITSIYHEPMIAWTYKRYFGGGDNAILFAATSKHEFIFRIRNKGTTIIIDDQEIGELRENGVLYSAKTERLMARINRKGEHLVLPVLFGDREIATIKRPDYVQQTNNRAFELLTEMSEEEEAVLMSFMILETVRPILKK